MVRAGLAQRRVEQNQRRIVAAERQKGQKRGQRVIDADGRFVSEGAVYGFEDEVVIVNQGRDVVLLPAPDAVPAMVSDVVDHQVEIVGEQGPERVIEIDGKTVAVAQHEPDAGIRIAVPAYDGRRPLVDGDLAYRMRFRNVPDGFSRHFSGYGRFRPASADRVAQGPARTIAAISATGVCRQRIEHRPPAGRKSLPIRDRSQGCRIETICLVQVLIGGAAPDRNSQDIGSPHRARYYCRALPKAPLNPTGPSRTQQAARGRRSRVTRKRISRRRASASSAGRGFMSAGSRNSGTRNAAAGTISRASPSIRCRNSASCPAAPAWIGCR